MRTPLAIGLLLTTACGTTSGADGPGAPAGASGGASDPQSPGPGGGGVSFGGAQDIGELRNILDNGGIPGPDTFDANGFFNEPYNAPPPVACGQVLCLVSGMSVGRDWVTGAHQATLQLSINTASAPAPQRLPMNLVVVVDHSGSMASDGRLDKVKIGLHTMIDQLHDDDRLAVVEFDDQVKVDAALGATLDRPALHAIIDGLVPGGSTDIFDGLDQGFRLLGDAPPSERQNRVILLSDGNATAGDVSQADILGMAQRRAVLGIGLTTIGVGDDFDVALMRGLAEQGAGNFYFLEDPAAATEVFTEELDFFMQPIALDIQIGATAGPGYQFVEAVGSNLWAGEPRRGAMQIPAVFASSRTTQSGEQGRRGGGSMIFIQINPVAGTTGRVADLTLSFRAPDSTERISQAVSLDYARDPAETPAVPYLSAPEMSERFGMYNMFLGIRAATVAPTPACAAAALRATRAAGTAWNQDHQDPDLAADLVLVDQYLANLRAFGAVDDAATVATCRTQTTPPVLPPVGSPPTDPPTDPPIDPPARSDRRASLLSCSTGGAAGGLPIALAALAALGSRRRRR